jgi:hypothetical protein
MNIKFYLIISEGGSVKAAKKRPGLYWNEISMLVSLQLPNSLFVKPQLSAEIKIPEEAGKPTEITADVIENVKAAIEKSSGMEVKLSIINPEP